MLGALAFVVDPSHAKKVAENPFTAGYSGAGSAQADWKRIAAQGHGQAQFEPNRSSHQGRPRTKGEALIGWGQPRLSPNCPELPG
jgi:hypothetical protein